MSLIETIDLCQSFGTINILKNVNLKVVRGEVVALIGPTGAGKTTLLRLINLLDAPVSGRIYFDGVEVAKSAMARLGLRRRMAFVLQKPVVFNMSVYNNIACVLKWRGVRESDMRQKVTNILEMIGLTGCESRNARTLSGGEVQKVAIGRAFATGPEVLLLDEPTANLSPEAISKVEELIADVRQRNNSTIIMATHDMAQGQRLADRIVVLMDGTIVQTGGSREIFALPHNRAIAEFVGTDNIIDGIIVSSDENVITIDIGGKLVEAISDYPVGEKVSVCIRPEEITLALSKISSSARNSFVGEVTRLVSMGPLTRVELNCGFPLVCLVTRKSVEEMNLAKGKQIYAAFKATATHVIRRDA